MAILLIEKNESLRAGFSAELQANFELEVFEFDGAKKAIETIDNNKEIAVVISDQSLAD